MTQRDSRLISLHSHTISPKALQLATGISRPNFRCVSASCVSVGPVPQWRGQRLMYPQYRNSSIKPNIPRQKTIKIEPKLGTRTLPCEIIAADVRGGVVRECLFVAVANAASLPAQHAPTPDSSETGLAPTLPFHTRFSSALFGENFYKLM
jgi:hypothetical protein